MDKSKEPKNHTVVIKVDEEGEFGYDNGLIWVYPGDTVVWECPRCEKEENPFSVHLGWDSPLKKGRFQSKKGEPIDTVVPDNARPGYYRYTVSALVNGKIWTDDPELIVRPPRGR